MNRITVVHVVAVLAIVVGAFWLHSCTAPAPYRDLFTVGEISAAPRLRVGITKYLKVDAATISVEGSCTIEGIWMEKLPLSEVHHRSYGIKIGKHKFKDVDSVYIVPEQDGTLRVGPRIYHGNLLILRDEKTMTLVNEVDLESYLKGVAGKEMSTRANPEALKAQIIAARTYAMYEVRGRTLRRVAGLPFDLFDDERSQVYGGMERETKGISKLVDETRGMFMIWEDRLIKAFYSSTCGGHTEPAWLILGEGSKIPPLGGTPCIYCKGSKYYEWSASFERSEAEKILFPDRPDARIEKIEITKTLPGGHALNVGVTLKNSSVVHSFHANNGFRRKLSPRRIRSTLWTKIESGEKEIRIHGRGFGHGAGMCQVGAYRMADIGKSGVEILEHYYPGVEVRKLY